MQADDAREEDLTGNEKDVDLGSEDVRIDHNGQIPAIAFSQKVHEQLIKPWQNAVVIKLLGRSLGYKALSFRLETLWSETKGYTIIHLENDYFLVKFKAHDDAMTALSQGPWTIMGHYLTVQP